MELLEEIRARIRAFVSGLGVTSQWISAHLEHSNPVECLIYPFRWEEGHYPKYKHKGKGYNWPVHRMMCEYRLGPAPSPDHHAAHSCGRGLVGCVNGIHVSWKTPSQNQFDRFDAPVKPRYKLTPEIADKIRLMSDTMLPGDIARQFGVTVRNVRFVLDGKAWATKAPKIFTAKEVLSIRSRRGIVPARILADEYGTSDSSIDRIMRGITYRWVTSGERDTEPQLP